MHGIKRELLLWSTVSALVFTIAVAWGSPFTMSPPSALAARLRPGAKTQQSCSSQPSAQMQQQEQTSTFSGTVVKSGASYALLDACGKTYKLNDTSEAEGYMGKAVRVLGQLDLQSGTIYGESIQPA